VFCSKPWAKLALKTRGYVINVIFVSFVTAERFINIR